jgi:hypothetical protein
MSINRYTRSSDEILCFFFRRKTSSSGDSRLGCVHDMLCGSDSVHEMDPAMLHANLALCRSSPMAEVSKTGGIERDHLAKARPEGP